MLARSPDDLVASAVESNTERVSITSGRGEIARKIIEIAIENDLAIESNPELLQMLLLIEKEKQIPVEVFIMISEILASLQKNS